MMPAQTSPAPEISPALAGRIAPLRAEILRAWAEGLAPDPERTVDAWADAERFVAAESGSPYPGRWNTDRVPYLREVMRCLSLAHPCRRVTFRKSAQIGGTEVGVNLLGQIIAETPAPTIVVLPSIDDARDYNRLKLQPMIDASPAVRQRCRDVVSRDEAASTVTFKRFAGGFVQIAGANSSKALQMRSARVVVLEEISEYPWDVDGRGDPVALAEARTIAFSGREKLFDNSTPAIEGSCRVTDLYARSSRGEYLVPCPHCQHRQALRWQQLRWPEGQPEAAEYFCSECGAAIAHRHKAAMIAAGAWVHAVPALVDSHAGFAINSLYSPFLSWADVARKSIEYADAGNLKAFTQQYLGEAWREQGEAPDHMRLLAQRAGGVEGWRAGELPPEALFLTGAADVQGDRIEYDVWAWGPGLSGYLVDTGMVEGNPMDPATWAVLGEALERHYVDRLGRRWPIDAFGVDTGYASQAVYRFIADAPQRERLFALDGRGDPRLPPLSTPRRVDIDYLGRKIGAINLWPVGTYGLKLAHYAAIRKAIAGPDADRRFASGALRLPEWVGEEYCRQLVSEYLDAVENRAGLVKREWRRIAGVRNERLDTAVYARALAHHLTDQLSAADWQNLIANRAGDPRRAQLDLFQSLAARLGAAAPAGGEAVAAPAAAASAPVPVAPPAPPPRPVPPPAAAARPVLPRRPWIEPRNDWF